MEKGYINEVKNFQLEIEKFYGKPRHLNYGVNFPVYTTKNQDIVYFHINVENDYYYGFTGPENKWWYGWKHSSRYNLDFWRLNSESFNSLKHPRERKGLIIKIFEEIHRYIEEFKKIANEKSI